MTAVRMHDAAPSDQAASLRRLVAVRSRPTRVLVIASGKGGVGKTNLAVNLGLAFQQLGSETLLLEADLGLGNAEVLLGAEFSADLTDWLSGACTFQDTVVEGPEGLQLVGAGSSLEQLADLDEITVMRLLGEVAAMPAPPEIMLVDLGAGLGPSVRAALSAARELLLVVTPEPTSMTDAYAIAKFLARHNPSIHLQLVVNRVKDLDEAVSVHRRLSRVIREFLGLRLSLAGQIPDDAAVGRAVRGQTPFLLTAPLAQASVAVRRLAADISGRRAQGTGQSILSYLASFVRRDRRRRAGEVTVSCLPEIDCLR
ncbi:MAG: MinD/ParA family protein [Thermaerobacterales bacterium]